MKSIHLRRTAPSTENETAADAVIDETPPPLAAAAAAAAEEERIIALVEKPPTDDVCPICFGNFEIPCKTPCGHWYCGRCILQLWNFSYASQPCKCPMCSRRITKLMPEASLYNSHEVEVRKLLRNVGDYNCLYSGGISAFMLKLRCAIKQHVRRRFREALNGERPLALMNDLRIFAMILGAVYSSIPVNFLEMSEQEIAYLFDRSAIAVYFIVCLVGIFLHFRRQRNIRQIVDLEAQND